MCEMLHRQRRTNGEYLLYNVAMGGERACATRMRRSGKICCECGAMLPPPYLQGERLCGRCGKDCAPKHRVYIAVHADSGLVLPVPGSGSENGASPQVAGEVFGWDLSGEQYAKLRRTVR